MFSSSLRTPQESVSYTNGPLPSNIDFPRNHVYTSYVDYGPFFYIYCYRHNVLRAVSQFNLYIRYAQELQWPTSKPNQVMANKCLRLMSQNRPSAFKCWQLPNLCCIGVSFKLSCSNTLTWTWPFGITSEIVSSIRHPFLEGFWPLNTLDRDSIMYFVGLVSYKVLRTA